MQVQLDITTCQYKLPKKKKIFKSNLSISCRPFSIAIIKTTHHTYVLICMSIYICTYICTYYNMNVLTLYLLFIIVVCKLVKQTFLITLFLKFFYYKLAFCYQFSDFAHVIPTTFKKQLFELLNVGKCIKLRRFQCSPIYY